MIFTDVLVEIAVIYSHDHKIHVYLKWQSRPRVRAENFNQKVCGLNPTEEFVQILKHLPDCIVQDG